MRSVELEVRGSVGVLTLARPDKLNAFTHEMGERFREAVGRLQDTPEVRAVILRGAGRAFSAGGDLEFLEANADRPFADNQAGMRDFYGKFLSIRELDVPSIALIHGRATGAGLALALACDLRVAASDSKVSANFVRVGLNPGMGLSWHLERLIGAGRARDLIFTGRDVAMDEALSMGLVTRVTLAERVEEEAFALAELLAANAPVALALSKGILQREGDTLDDVLDLEAEAQAHCFGTSDLLEGVRAVRERRAPRFAGA